jgi:hypothetical protein
MSLRFLRNLSMPVLIAVSPCLLAQTSKPSVELAPPANITPTQPGGLPPPPPLRLKQHL